MKSAKSLDTILRDSKIPNCKCRLKKNSSSKEASTSGISKNGFLETLEKDLVNF